MGSQEVHSGNIGSGPSLCTATPLCMWQGVTMIPDSYLNIQIVRVRDRENRRRSFIYSIKLWIGPDPYHLAPVFLSQRRSPYGACFPRYSFRKRSLQSLLSDVFLSSGDYHTELAFRDITLRMEAYRACSTSHCACITWGRR